MKILNYSTWYLLFTTIMQAVSGYTCPNSSTINTKITENDTMIFPLAERGVAAGQGFFLRYRSINSNKIEKFYTGESEVDKFTGVFYHPQTPELAATLTCIYKQKNNKFLVLPMTKRGANRVNGAAIENELNNWQVFRNSSFFVCGNSVMDEENLGNCQFFLESR